MFTSPGPGALLDAAAPFLPCTTARHTATSGHHRHRHRYRHRCRDTATASAVAATFHLHALLLPLQPPHLVSPSHSLSLPFVFRNPSSRVARRSSRSGWHYTGVTVSFHLSARHRKTARNLWIWSIEISKVVLTSVTIELDLFWCTFHFKIIRRFNLSDLMQYLIVFFFN